jgi:quercetin dioxygenase-like cupin family protein
MIRTLMLTVCAASIAGSAASAQVMPKDLKWGPAPPGLPAGAQLAVLSGDPTKQGMFTIRLKFPAGYSVAPHHHPTPELVTVMEGSLSVGMGDTADWAKASSLGVGGFVDMPPNMNHFASTAGGATIQIISHGPFEIIYVDPKDDPRRAAAAGAPAATERGR